MPPPKKNCPQYHLRGPTAMLRCSSYCKHCSYYCKHGSSYFKLGFPYCKHYSSYCKHGSSYCKLGSLLLSTFTVGGAFFLKFLPLIRYILEPFFIRLLILHYQNNYFVGINLFSVLLPPQDK